MLYCMCVILLYMVHGWEVKKKRRTTGDTRAAITSDCYTFACIIENNVRSYFHNQKHTMPMCLTRWFCILQLNTRFVRFICLNFKCQEESKHHEYNRSFNRKKTPWIDDEFQWLFIYLHRSCIIIYKSTRCRWTNKKAHVFIYITHPRDEWLNA